MNWQPNPYLALLLTTALVSVVISWIAWKRRTTPGTTTIIGLLWACALWAFLYALELSAADLSWQIWFAKLQYLGIVAIPTLWFVFTIQYTRHDAWLTPLRHGLLVALPAAFFSLVASNDLHGLVWRFVGQLPYGPAMILSLRHGPGFSVIWIYSYVLLVAGSVLLVKAWVESPALYRRQITLILGGAAVPWIANLLYVVNDTSGAYLDLTPFAFTLTGLAGAWGLLRYGLLGLIPLARNQMIELMKEAVIVADIQGRVLDINPAACRLLAGQGTCAAASDDRAAQPWIGQPLAQALAGWPELLDCCMAEPVFRCEVERRQGDQTAYYEVQISTIETRPGEHSARMLVLSEISEHKRIEAELRQASTAKSNFLATMSHELRTPLTVIIGYSEILLDEARQEDWPEAALRLERITSSAQHLLALVNDLLDLSRIEAGRVQLFCSIHPVDCLLAEALAIGRPLAERSHNQLVTELEDNLGQLNGDAMRIRQVLINLISNAAKFTQNGKITLQARRWTAADQSDWLEFTVHDTGIGIPAEAIPRLFQSFSQVDPSSTRQYGGAGLGLAISQRLCHLMGGEISVESQPGAGSAFRVRLPAITPQAEPPSPGQAGTIK